MKAEQRKRELEALKKVFIKQVDEGKSSDATHTKMVILNLQQLKFETRQDRRKQRSA